MRIFGRVEFTSENLDSQVVRARVQGELAFLEKSGGVVGLGRCGSWRAVGASSSLPRGWGRGGPGSGPSGGGGDRPAPSSVPAPPPPPLNKLFFLFKLRPALLAAAAAAARRSRQSARSSVEPRYWALGLVDPKARNPGPGPGPASTPGFPGRMARSGRHRRR